MGLIESSGSNCSTFSGSTLPAGAAIGALPEHVAALEARLGEQVAQLGQRPQPPVVAERVAQPAAVLHHEIDTLVHKVAENSDVELFYTGGLLTRATVWTDATRTIRIRESTLSYTGPDLTGVVTTQHDAAGATVCTLTRTLVYVGGNLDTITVVKS